MLKLKIVPNSPLYWANESYRLLSDEDKKAHEWYVEKIKLVRLAGAEDFDSLYFKNNKKIKEQYADLVTCPKDPTHPVVKYGKARNNRQRYICKTCNTTFYATRNTLTSHTSQDIATWYSFIHGVLSLNSVEQLSSQCHISTSTASHWKMLVFEALGKIMENVKLTDIIIADEKMVTYNLKGKHGKEFVFPRNPRNRGGMNTIKNHHKNQLCILCAVDNHGNSMARIIGFGQSSKESIANGFKGKIDTDNANVLVTDGSKNYSKAFKVYNFKSWERKTSVKKGSKRLPNTQGPYNIQKVNAYHSELERFLAHYRGVSSRLLKGYLHLFEFLKYYRDESKDYLCNMILAALSEITDEKTTRESINKKYRFPVSNGKEQELWERKIPRKEQKVYIDYVNKMPLSKIMEKHKVNKRKIYTIKDKVKKYGVHDAIINPPKKTAIKTKSVPEYKLELFRLKHINKLKTKDIADTNNYSRKGLSRLFVNISKTPEGMAILDEAKKIEERKKKRKEANSKNTKLKKRYTEIYNDFKFLSGGGGLLKDIYKNLANKYNYTVKSIEYIILNKRHEDPHARYSYHWKDRTNGMDRDEYSEYLDKRNEQIYSKYMELLKSGAFRRKKDIYNALATEYQMSEPNIQLIIGKIGRTQAANSGALDGS